MALKKILTSQEDFTGEFQKTDKTTAYWKFNERNADFHDDDGAFAGAISVSEPTGFPRYEVDGFDEDLTFFKQKMDGTDTDLTLAGATIYEDDYPDTGITRFNGKALDLSTGSATLPTMPFNSDNRTVSIWYRPVQADIDGGGWRIFATQRTNGNRGYHFSIYNGEFVIRAYNDAGLMVINTDMAGYKAIPGEWYLLSINSSNTEWEVTVNGVRGASGYLTHPIRQVGRTWELGSMAGGNPAFGLIGGMFANNGRYMATLMKRYYDNVDVSKSLIPAGITLNPTGTWNEASFNALDYSGKTIYTDTDGIVEYTFTGTAVYWLTRTGANLGMANVYIDGVLKEEVDLFNTETEHQVRAFGIDGLERKQHVIKIERSGNKNTSSTGTRIFHDAIEVGAGNNKLKDSSGNGNDLELINYATTTAVMLPGEYDYSIRFNTLDPQAEKSHLRLRNKGDLLTNIGKRLVVGGWIIPTTYSATTQFVPLFSTREDTDAPLIYISLIRGQVNVRLYDQAGAEIYNFYEDTQTPISLGLSYFIGVEVDTVAKTVKTLVANRNNDEVYEKTRDYTGTLNQSSTADVVLGMYANAYYYSGYMDDWFFEKNSDITFDDLKERYYSSVATRSGNLGTEIKVDPYKISGSVVLRSDNGVYEPVGILETRAINLNEGIKGIGKISVVGESVPGVAVISDIKTRTRQDMASGNWSEWISINSEGEIISPNYQFIQIQVVLRTTDTSRTPEIMEIQIHEITKAPYERLGYARPVILSQSENREAVLENAFDIIVSEEVNGAQYVNFKLPYNDEKRQTIENEKLVQFTKDTYRVRTITDDKDESGKTITSVYAEADFYNLAFSDPIPEELFVEVKPTAPMLHALAGTGWTLGDVTVTSIRTWDANEINALTFLRKIQELWGGDLVFNNGQKTVSLLDVSGKDDGVVFAYRKNMKSIQKVVDTKELITKLFVYGKDGLSIADANQGRDFLVDYSYTNEIRALKIENNSFTNPYQLKEWADERIAELSLPRISYVIKVMDLSTLTGWEHETFNLGDMVIVDDQELGIKVKTRIIRREYNVQEPWKTVIELSTKLRELGDETARWKQTSGALQDADYVSGQDISKLMVFNYLLNSRGDDGFAYWQNAGFELDANNGFSGNASFKVSGQLGKTKSLLQTVHPSNRDAYTISSKISTQDLEKGVDGRVGIEVKVYYEDGTSEIQFIPL